MTVDVDSDGLGWLQEFNFLMEIKDGSKPPSARKLTPGEQQWHETWKGQVCVVRNVEEALREVGIEI